VASAEKAANILTALEPADFRILQAIELGMIQHQIVPFKSILKYSGLHEKEIEYRLKELHAKDVFIRESEPYRGYLLTYVGYDALTLNAFVKGNFIDALGSPIGKGKESDVYEAFDSNRESLIMKFHRLGRTSFRATRRKREYVADRRHISWLYQSRLAAEKEYEALQKLFSDGISVPQPFHQNRNGILMEFLDAYQLNEVESLDEPLEYLEEIMENMEKTYRAGLIHADLSEYNILVSKQGKLWIIDWPQYVSTDHPNNEMYLTRDLGNVNTYFERKFNVSLDLEEILDRILDRS